MDFIRAPFSRSGAVVLLVRAAQAVVLVCCLVGVLWLVAQARDALASMGLALALLVAAVWAPARQVALLLCLVVFITTAGPGWGLLLIPLLCGGAGGSTTNKTP